MNGETRQLSVFVRPEARETVNSVVSRMLYRYPITQATLGRAFGDEAVYARLRVHPALPLALDGLSRAMPEGHPWRDPRLIVHEHTTLPYFTSFEKREHGEALIDRFLASGRGRRMSLGLTKFPAEAAPAVGRFCPQCVEEDRQTECGGKGFPIFYVEHQLPCVAYCWRHRVLLQQGCTVCGATERFGLAGRCGDPHHQSYLPAWTNLPSDQASLLWLARESAELLRRPRDDNPGEVLIKLARAQLPRYAPHREVADKLRAAWPDETLKWMGLEMTPAYGPTWHERLFRTERRSRNTLAYLALLKAFYPSVAAFEEAAVAWRCRSLILRPKRVKVLQIIELPGIPDDEIVEEDATVLVTACQAPRTGAWAAVDPEAAANLLNALRSGLSKQEIRARRIVSRFRLELILAGDPDLQEEWREAWLQQSVEKSKGVLRAAMEADPSATRTELQIRFQGHFNKLRQRDPEWLSTSMPQRVFPPAPKPGHYWMREDQVRERAVRDLEWAAEVPVVAARILGSADRPRWVSVQRLYDEIGLKREASIPRLYPLTVAAIEAVTETKDQFEIRVIDWGLRQFLIPRRRPVSINVLRRVCSMNPGKITNRLDYVCARIAELGLRAAPSSVFERHIMKETSPKRGLGGQLVDGSAALALSEQDAADIDQSGEVDGVNRTELAAIALE